MQTNTHHTPDPFATNSEKQSKAYGLGYAQFIQSEWIANGKLAARNTKFKRHEAFKNNEVDIDKYKHILGMCSERVWTGMNWAFTPIAPKFVNVIKEGFSYELFKINAKAVDAISQKERNACKKNLRAEMRTADFTRQISAATGTDYTPAYTPESEEELNVYMQLKYKQPREIASELIINRIMDLNGWDETINAITEDIITNRIGAAKVTPDKNYGVKIERIEPKNLIYSCDTKNSRNKKGTFYFGETKTYTKDEILRLADGEITPEDLKKTAGRDDSKLVDVLYFCFKTTVDQTYKRKKNSLIPKQREFQLHPQSKSRIVKGRYDVWFEGYYIIDTDLMWGYRLMEDMVRPTGDINRVMPPYAIYELSVPSVLENIIPFCEDAHISVLKLRHLVIRAKPKGFEINIDALQQIDLGGGKPLTPAEVIEIYDQTGTLLTSTRGFDEEDRNFGQVLKDINSSLGTDLMQLIGAYNQAVNMCYEVSGLNRVRDGSAPLNGTLVGTQQVALTMSNNATKHILNGLISIEKDIAEIALNRSQQIAMYDKTFSDNILQSFLDCDDKIKHELISSHRYKFDVLIQVAPDQVQKQSLDTNIMAAIQSQQITLSDSIDIKSIDNIKLANEYLKIRMNKREKTRQQYQIQAIQAKEQARAQANAEIQNADMQKLKMQAQLLQMQAQSDISVNNAKIEKQTEAQLIIMNKDFTYKTKLQSQALQTSAELNLFKESAKDRRIDQQSQNQSQLIFQRQNQTTPKKFINPET